MRIWRTGIVILILAFAITCFSATTTNAEENSGETEPEKHTTEESSIRIDDLFKKGNEQERKKVYGINYPAKPYFNFKPTYRALFEIGKIIPDTASCDDINDANELRAGGKSIFKELGEDDMGKYKIISFSYVAPIYIWPGSKIQDTTTPRPVINKPYKLCLNSIPSYTYEKRGGLITGVLVVPFKFRDGKLFSDSTIGPYVGFGGSRWSTVATVGLTQISTSEIDSADVESETGLTFAGSVIFSVSPTFDIGFVAGIDHLSGKKKSEFEYQDKLWYSFGIGYNFTK